MKMTTKMTESGVFGVAMLALHFVLGVSLLFLYFAIPVLAVAWLTEWLLFP